MNFTTYVGAISTATDAVAWTDDGVALGVYRGGEAQYTLQIPDGVGALAFSPDGALLAVGDKAGRVQLVRAGDGTVAQTVQGQQALTVLQFSPDGALLGGREIDGTLSVWTVAEGAPVVQIVAEASDAVLPHDAPRRDPFIFTHDGTMLITAGTGPVRFYRTRDGQLLHQLEAPAEDVAIGPRQRLLGLVRGGRVELWGIP
jgi:WD40 repeat protein